MIDAPAELAVLRRFAERPGRHRMLRLIAPLRSTRWWRRLDAIKIAGSNGKGSVATMVASILGATGVSVGLTVSPHIVDFAERIQVDGEPVTASGLAAAVDWLRPRLDAPTADSSDPPLAFEAITALALRVFEQRQVDSVVAEAGIGGRHDAVGVLPGALSAIVSVDLEHTAILGATLGEIATDKAELAAEGTTLLLGPVSRELLDRVVEHCRRRRVTVVAFNALDALPAGVDLPARGAYQLDNAKLAAALARRWLTRHRPTLGRAEIDAAIRDGLAAVALPARFEKVRTHPPVWIDSGHTPDALARLADTARHHIDRPILLVAGLSVGREPSVLEPLIALAKRVVVTRAADRGASPAPICRLAEAMGRPTTRIEPASRAIEVAVAAAADDGDAVLVAGGLMLAREVRRVLITAR